MLQKMVFFVYCVGENKIKPRATGLYTGILLKNKRVPKLPDFEVFLKKLKN
jgi:hypothetical protein